MLRSTIGGGESARLCGRRLGTGGLAAMVVLLGTTLAPTEQPPVVELEAIAGDYRVSVHPEAFGFVVRDGVLHLKMGGVDGDAPAVPLSRDEAGRFTLAEGHPNAFAFELDGGQVRFTLYAMGQPIPGERVTADAAAPTAGSGPSDALDPAERTRAELLEQLDRARVELDGNPGDAATRLRYARHLYEAGEFRAAREVMVSVDGPDGSTPAALALRAELHYLTGAYVEAERTYRHIVEAPDVDAGARVMAQVGQLFTHYQRNQFLAARALEFPPGVELPNAVQMAAFDTDPYALDWHSDERVTRVPFLVTDPLPVLTLEVHGVPVHVLFDTGADQLILDDEIAAGLGVEPVATAIGSFGGGLKGEVGFGRVEQVRIGDVTLREVPVTVLPTKRFSSAFGEGRWPIGGVVGTALVRQFLSTVDYGSGQLVLRERTAEQRARAREEASGRSPAEIPFVLSATHLMMARGSLNGFDGLTFFVDSGLAGDAAVAVPIQTLALLGIPEPETKVGEDSVGGGGGHFATGELMLDRVALGELVQTDVVGSYGARPPSSYWERGFLQDALISHAFFRQYDTWTLDFDAMTYLITRE